MKWTSIFLEPKSRKIFRGIEHDMMCRQLVIRSTCPLSLAFNNNEEMCVGTQKLIRENHRKESHHVHY